jgi:hypothetical protein
MMTPPIQSASTTDAYINSLMIAGSPAHFCLVCYAALADDRHPPFRSY